MRILHVILTMDPQYGGPVEGIRAAAALFAAQGHQLEIVTTDDPSAAFLADSPVPVHAMGPARIRYGFTPRLMPWLIANAHRFDAAVIHGLWNYTGFSAWRAFRKRLPYVVFSHGMLDPWFNTVQPVKRWAKQAYWLAVDGRVLGDASAVLFTSEDERLLARTAFAGHTYAGKVVAFGADQPPENLDQAQADFAALVPRLGNRRYLLFISRLHPKKGCDLLIEAFADIAARYPDLDLVMAGPDQVGWGDTLRALSANLGIADRIHWPGMVSGDAKWAAFRGAEAFVLTSHSENFGIVVAEAMASSTPALISTKVNIWREVEASGGGLVAPDTLDSSKALLAKFLALPDAERSQMRAAARRGYETSFAMDRAVSDLLSSLDAATTDGRNP